MGNIDIKKIVNEEIAKMISEAKKKAPSIEKKLFQLREKLFPEMLEKESFKETQPAMERRLDIHTVSELLDVPVNELMLYFMNEVKPKNTRSLIEYRLGHIVFYAC